MSSQLSMSSRLLTGNVMHCINGTVRGRCNVLRPIACDQYTIRLCAGEAVFARHSSAASSHTSQYIGPTTQGHRRLTNNTSLSSSIKFGQSYLLGNGRPMAPVLTPVEGAFLYNQRQMYSSPSSLSDDRTSVSFDNDYPSSDKEHPSFTRVNSGFSSNQPHPRRGMPVIFTPSGTRFIHTSSSLHREESKVEETLEAIKETMKQKEAVPEKVTAASVDGVTSDAVPTPAAVAVQTTAVAVPKKSLKERAIAELKHYYHGFRLLFIDMRVASRMIWQVLNGKSLTRREQKQLVRTTADMFRLVPFLVFVIVPFAEFLLPVALKLFPGMLPSTFQEADLEREKSRKRLKGKLEMAKFLQDTIEETALQRTGASGDSVHEFGVFMQKIRTSGEQTSNEEILKFSKIFEDEITLDNLTYAQLKALCQLLEIPAVGTSYVLRFQLEMKLRQLEADDKMIQKEGLDAMAVWELQDACRARGMRAVGLPEVRLKNQLAQWLDLNLNLKVPASLLLLSRTLYLPENLTFEEQIRASISVLPEATAEEAKVKILEVFGDRVDNKSKLEVIKQEEEIILKEKMEQELKETEENKIKQAAEALKAEPAMIDSAALIAPTNAELMHPWPAEVLPGTGGVVLSQEEKDKAEEIDSSDLGKIEDILERVAETKIELNAQVEDLKTLKEDVNVYIENLQDLQGVVASSGGPAIELKESLAAQRLAKKVSKLISQIDLAVEDLSHKKEALIDDIRTIDERTGAAAALVGTGGKLGASEAELLKDHEKRHVVTIIDLLDSIKSATDAAKLATIAKVLDEDKDGIIDVSDALKVIELLGKENMTLNADQLADIMSILRKEHEIKDEEKKAKKLQHAADISSTAAAAAAAAPTTAGPATSERLAAAKQEKKSKESQSSKK